MVGMYRYIYVCIYMYNKENKTVLEYRKKIMKENK